MPILKFLVWILVLYDLNELIAAQNCKTEGTFQDEEDLTCTKYYICSLKPDGSFLQTYYECPSGSFFGSADDRKKFAPTNGLCSAEYSCKINSSVTTKCQNVGRFEDPEDSSCTNYYLCTRMPDGTYLKTKYSCEDKKYFDPFVRECSKLYTCSKPECKSAGRTPDFTDRTCMNYHLCTELPNGSILKTSYSCPDGKKFDPNLKQCSTYYTCPHDIFTSTITADTTSNCMYEEDNFNCSETGRFKKPNDMTCTKYYLCSLVLNIFIKTEYSCPFGFYFDQSTHICSEKYKCPCIANLPTSQRTDKPFNDSKSTSTATAVATTTKITECLDSQNDTQEFVCSEEGRFFNPKDVTCTKYFLCSHLRNGSFIQTEYNCPVGSYFDPELHLCSILYQCPCPTTTVSSTESSVTTSEISNPLSTTSLQPSTIKSTASVSTTTTKPSVCVATQNDTQEFVCSEKGRFFNPKDVTCTKYFLCSHLRNGSFIQTEYGCPVGSYFDPELHLCSILYQCPCTTSTTSSTKSSVTTSKTSSSLSTTSLQPSTTKSTASVSTTTTKPSVCLAIQNDTQEFVCSEKGRFFNPKDVTCTKYFLCSHLRNGSFIQTEYGCPVGSYFDPELHLCSILYQCPCTTSTTSSTKSSVTTSKTSSSLSTTSLQPSTTKSTASVSTTTTKPSVCLAIQNDTQEFVCSEKGRFFNPKDVTCTKYFLCSHLRNGSFIQTEYGCPVGSHFDPELHLCSILYQCPCTTTTVSSTKSSVTTSKTSSSLSTTSLQPSTTKSTASVSTTTTKPSVCLAIQNDTQEFVCSEKGRFFNPKDVTCTKYFLCSHLRNGSFIQTEYGCPVGSYFDPELHLCSILYQCPCTTSTTSSTKSSVTTSKTSSSLSTTSLQPSTTKSTASVSTTTTKPSVCLAIQNDTQEFVCSEKGRFFNPKDVTCTKYFLCSHLRNGSFIQTEYGCPVGSYFDPELHLCSILYQCPCTTSTTSSTKSSVTISKTSSSLSTTSLQPSTTKSTASVSTTTTEPSVCLAIQNDTQEFVCSEKGRFFNPKDVTCTKYFLCSHLRNGSFIQTEYGCPVGSYFDPELHLCSILYQCPCTTSTTSSTKSSVTTSEIPSSLSTTSLQPSTSKSTASVSTTTTKPSVCLATQNDTQEFVCSEKGRFFNPKDVTCTKYFLCSHLRNGSFIQTEYGCPVGSYFDPELHLCSILYQCPCTTSTTSSTKSSVTTSEIPSSLSTTSLQPSTTKSTASVSTTTTEPSVCLAIQNDTQEFVCSEKGRFFNPKDVTCTKYFLCSHLRNGSFIQTEYGCPVGSYFDPELHLCSILYQCPCTTTTVSSTKSSVTTSKTSSSLSTTSLQPSTTKSTASVSTTTTKPSVCVATQNDTQEFVCSEKGRFFNPKDVTCTKYFLCSHLRNGSFIQTEYGCPVGSYFDPELHLCSILYQCPCTTSTTSPTKSSVTTSETSSSLSTTSLQPSTTKSTASVSTTTTKPSVCLATQNDTQEFVCSEKGRFFNPKDVTCTKYFLCSHLRNGSFIQTEYGCPVGSYFDPELHLCSILYQCPCTTSTTSPTKSSVTTSETSSSLSTTSLQPSTTKSTPSVSTTTTKPSVCFATQNDTQEFVCSQKGRFFNPKDVTCTKYFLCSHLRNGSFIQTEYGCPVGSYFDPELHLCSILYQCPCTTSTTSPTKSSVTTSETSSSLSTTSLQPSTTKSTASVSTTTTKTSVCLATQNDTQEFVCSEKGRFFNPKDVTCTKYFLCSHLRNGSFIQTEYGCPVGSYFDPELHLCSILYQCPCTTTTTSSTKSSVTTSKTSSSLSTTSLQPSTTKSTASVSTTTTKPSVCLATQNDTQEFVCSEKGRFFNPKDVTCTKYFLCSHLRNGSFIQTEYGCPVGSYFDPELHLCSILYQCPCTTSTTSSTKSSVTTSEISSSLSTTSLQPSTTKSTASVSTTTTEPSVCLAIQNDTQEFVCSEKGRFFNPKDVTCTKYFLCSHLRNGSFIQTEYGCPVGSYFDPELHLCSILYQCPCTTTTVSSTKSSVTTSKTSSSLSTTSLQPSTTKSTASVSTTTTKPSVCLATQNDTQEFVCSEKGRFFNPKDVTCTKYFLCSHLRNGSFIQTEYGCPVGSYFDPELHLCSILYQCPCKTTTVSSTKSSVTTSKTSSSLSTTSLQPSTTKSTASVSTTTTKPSVCLATQNDTQEFVCSEKGRFFNPKDVTCTKYFLCSHLRNGSFIQTEYGCPVGSYFDPELHLCSILYQCPCTTTTVSSTKSSVTTSKTSSSLSTTSLQPSTTKSTASVSTTTTKPSVCLATQNDTQEFVCSEKGRFFNPKDVTCTKYFLCSHLRNGSFIQTEYGCPVGSYFDPELHLCSILYQCPCKTTTVSSTKSSVTTSKTSSSLSTTSLQPSTTKSTASVSTTTTKPSVCLATQNDTQEFVCSEKGRFFNPKDVTCTKYFLCSHLRNGSFIQTEYGCPVGSYFDPELHLCSILYQCPCTTTTVSSTKSSVTTSKTSSSLSTTSLQPSTTKSTASVSTTTTKPSVCLATQNDTQEFVCSEKGRFFNPKDVTCTKYFLCSHLRNGSFIQTEYGCPVGSYFDPELHLCSILYQCPCTTSTTSSTKSSVTTSKTLSSLSTSLQPSTTKSTASVSTTTTEPSVCLATQNDTQEFVCSEKGRFFNPKDVTCTKYFLCSHLRNGSFIQTEYRCPLGSYFVPGLHLCSIFYKCPCPKSTKFSSESSTVMSSRMLSSLSTVALQLSTTESSTSVLMTSLKSASERPNDCLSIQIDSEDFICLEQGLFVNPKDTSYRKYFFCSLLHNGSFNLTECMCPFGLYFNPMLHTCSKFYNRPFLATSNSTTIAEISPK